MISDEFGLMLVMVGLYLYDSIVMLAINEALLIRASRKRWRVAFGIQNYRLAGREPLLPNPFAPHRRIYRMAWAIESVGKHDEAFLATLDDDEHFGGLGIYVWLMAIALFVLVPIGLFSRLGYDFVLMAIGLFYLSALSALSQVYLSRKRFGLGKGDVASIALQSLICPPFAINLVRKLCASEKSAGDLLATASLLLSGSELEVVRMRCRERLDEQIDLEPEGSTRSLAMIGLRRQLLQREEAEQ